MSNESTLRGFFLQMLRSSVVQVTSFVYTKTIILFDLSKYSATINLDFKE